MDNYIALGDSITISSYPSLDAGLGSGAKIGAGDLTGRALILLGHVHRMHNLACDGATILDVYHQIRMLPPDVRSACNIITLTAGGNDISFAGMQRRQNKEASSFNETMMFVQNRYVALVEFIRHTFPNSILVVNSLYDPTDGTGKLDDCGSWSMIADWYSRGRRQLGDFIRENYAAEDGMDVPERVLFYDVFKLFDGHGMKQTSVFSRWYYSGFMIEPGCTGAKEISSAWLDVICKWIAEQQEPQRRLSFSH